MSGRGKLFSAVIVVVCGALAFVYGQVGVATEQIKFDLRKIGESIYQAHSRTGKWPSQIADLEGTEYLSMPYRRDELERGLFVVVWQQDLDPNPVANRNRVLTYDNGSLLSRLGLVWACRGDLSMERISAKELEGMKVHR
jgi:hypothetical protein